MPGEIDCHAADLTATISARMPLAAAQDRLAQFDQWIPIDGDPQAPVGQLVERNSTGPLRLGFGAWRDLLLGCQFRLRNGQLITAGGRTMKNVAGYDLTKFAVGHWGRFGTPETITIRTYKRPVGALLVEFAAANQFFGQIVSTSLRPAWALLTPQSLFCGWLDEEPGLALVERLIAPHQPLRVSRRSLDEDIADRARLWRGGPDMFKASVPPNRILAFIETSGLARWVADPAFGIVIGPLDQIDDDALENAARAAEGSVVLVRDDRLLWHGSESEQRVLAALQTAFEPD
jgi:FAD/FMN-containing dehydrogenase